MGLAGEVFNVAALAFSFAAVIVSITSARRQAADARRSNYIAFVSEFGQRLRTPEFRKAQDYILKELSQFDPTLGIYSLPEPIRDYVLLVGGFYQDVGALVVTGVLDEEIAVTMYYSGIKEIWRALEPYILGEREIRRSRGMGSMYSSFEHIAVYVESVPHDRVVRKFRRRSFQVARADPAVRAGSVESAQNNASQSGPCSPD